MELHPELKITLPEIVDEGLWEDLGVE